MNTFLSADFHLGETRLDIMGRPFKSTDEMTETLIDNFNNIIQPEDELIFNGDVCYKETPEKLYLISRFNGKKTLIRGNHDRVFSDRDLKPYFDTIIPEGEGIEMDIHGLQCYITHYPTCGKIGKFNLVGHIHSSWKYQLNSLNIGIDVHHFRPVNINSIPFHFKAICEYYDEDVWVAYNEINQIHRGDRGKKGTYFIK